MSEEKQQQTPKRIAGILLGNKDIKNNHISLWNKYVGTLNGSYVHRDYPVECGVCVLIDEPEGEYNRQQLQLSLYDLDMARRGFMYAVEYRSKIDLDLQTVGTSLRPITEIVLSYPVQLSEVETFIRSEQCKRMLCSDYSLDHFLAPDF